MSSSESAEKMAPGTASGDGVVKPSERGGAATRFTVDDVQKLICHVVMALATLVHFDLKSEESIEREDGQEYTGDVMASIRRLLDNLCKLCSVIGVDLARVVVLKMRINRLKYDEDLCRQAADVMKYNKMAGSVFLGKDADALLGLTRDEIFFRPWLAIKAAFLKERQALRAEAYHFGNSRGWLDKYTPMSVCMSLVTEVGELAEVLQWKSRKTPVEELNDDVIDRLAREVADVTIYLCHYERICIYGDHCFGSADDLKQK